MSEVFQPPRGYSIGFFTGEVSAMIGCFATEDEARELLSKAEIVAVGAPTGWHNWCGATQGALFCNKPKGHEQDGWHDNGSVAWPTELTE